jgi:glutathione synthase/RimK-type ligase-like ATP-grasp enzyme
MSRHRTICCSDRCLERASMHHKPVVLILTEEMDEHANMIVPRLVERGVRPLRIHTADFPLSATIDIVNTHGEWKGYLECSSGRVYLDEIRSAWFRRPNNPDLSKSGILPEAQRFAQFETKAACQGLWRSLSCFWVSHPDKIESSSYKVEQLQSAAIIGLKVPKTIVTNNPNTLLSFYHTCKGEVVYKTLWRPVVEYQHISSAIYTTPLSSQHLDNLETVSLSACLFQEYIPKAFELRITIIGRQVFAVAIHSQESSIAKHDWRRYDLDNTPHYIFDLPSDIADKCRSLVIDHYGLCFGAIDMIVTPEGDYVFLELNPNGQWAWLELLTGIPLSDTLADLLAVGHLI